MTGKTENKTSSRKTDTLAFFKGFLNNPDTVASVIPSSRFLERQIIDAADIRHARLVVELGPGTGGTTRAILRALPQSGRLLTIELNPDFIALLNRIDDPRLINHTGNATEIRNILEHYGLPSPDVVISGIPFSTMPATTGKAILNAMWGSLVEGGRFVAYQFRSQVALLGREVFGNPEFTRMELRNAPPMRVYRWVKTADASVVAL